MARKRMIDPSFWSDEQLGECTKEARLLFMGLISQADDDGRLNGHPALIKSTIFPYDLDISLETVEEWLASLSDRRLIVRYTYNNQKFIFVRNFKKHQTINKPVKSKLPEPPPDDYGNTTVVVQEEDSTSHAQEKLIEVNIREDNNNTVVVVENPFTTFEREGFGTISEYIRDEIVRMSTEHSDQWVCDAMRAAVREGKRKLSYVDGILKNWKADGRDSNGSSTVGRTGRAAYRAEPEKKYIHKDVPVYYGPGSGEGDHQSDV